MKNKILYKRSLRTCIIMLVVCIVFKLFGVKWFDLNTSIPILQKLDKIIMNNYIYCLLYSSILLSVNLFFIISITLNLELKESFKYTSFTFPFTIIFIILKTKIHYNLFLTLSGFIYIISVCKIINHKVKIKRILGVIILNIIYQFISCYLRDIGFHNGNYGCVISVLMMIDYYIMLIITYLMKGEKLCQIFQVSFSSLQRELLKKHSKNYSENKGDN